mmetsp:Transcript_74481/g.197832  ORF Transcript_74481/g.197832 Transcript_74481/m.197832 type:complete len:237 (-) Transcript_74481:138-848(-)
MIAAALAEKRALAAQAVAASTPPSSRASEVSLGDVSNQSFLERREAELAVRKALRSKVEQAAKQKVEQLNGRDSRAEEPEEPEALIAAKRAVAAGIPLRPQISMGECAICGSAIEAKHAKRLPCDHVFHFGCIDEFHRQKMRRDKDVSLPCYTCKAPTHRSISVMADERRARREAEAAKAAQEAEAAARAAEAEAAQAQAAASKRQHSVPRRRGGALAALARAAQGGGASPEGAES